MPVAILQAGPAKGDMRQVRPLTSKVKLADSLAQRVYQLRMLRKLSLAELSKLIRFTPRRLEDIETGLETWLSYADRQKLAKGLGVEPALLKEVESRPVSEESGSRELVMRELNEQILAGNYQLNCPDCSTALKCSIQEGEDIEGNPLRFAKAFCTRCPFVLR